jgi:hypothetical protein
VGRRPDLGIPAPQIYERLAFARRSLLHPSEQRREVLLREPLETIGPWTHRRKVVTDESRVACFHRVVGTSSPARGPEADRTSGGVASDRARDAHVLRCATWRIEWESGNFDKTSAST